MTTRSIKIATLALVWGGYLVTPCSAQDFRMVTKIYKVGKDEQPPAENLTVFSGGRVYDFILTGESETTIYDPRKASPEPGRFILLDNFRKLKTEISLDEVTEMSAALTELGKQASLLVRAAADPKFQETFDEESGELRLTNDLLGYRVELQDVSGDIAVKFRDFADWYARLNVTREGALPPSARLELNKALASRQKIPRMIERTTILKKGFSKTEEKVRSEHKFAWRVLAEDRKRIDKATGNISRFKQVSLSEYRGLIPPLADSKATRR